MSRSSNVLNGVEIAKGLPLTHLFFVDDVILFVKATRHELYALMDIFNRFSKASGQRINLLKSGIVFSKDVDNGARNGLADVLNIPVWDNVGSYLGVPVEWGKSKTQALN